MKLSVVIVSYNVSELLEKCLQSLEVAIKKVPSEIFVVDNDSQDGSTDMVREKFKQVKLIANKNNVGFSKANNQAMKRSKGDYLLVLNPDTELSEDTIVKMLNFMDQKPDEVAVATCRIELPNGDLDKDCRRSFPTPFNSFCHFSGLSKIFRGSKLFDSYNMGYVSPNQESEIDACVGAFMLIRKSAISEIGFFDEDYFFYGEDLDFCYRAKQKGYKVIYTPITKIIHHKGASSGIKRHSQEISKAPKESRKRSVRESTRAMELFYKKHYRHKYPYPLTAAVLAAIECMKYLRLLRITLS